MHRCKPVQRSEEDMIPEPTASKTSVQTDPNPEPTSSRAVNHSEEESGNENQRKSVRRRKKAHKVSEDVKSKRAESSRGRCGRAGGRQGNREQAEAVTLFEVITMGRNAIKTVIDDWIEAYVEDRDSSLLDLISFFIQCSGCKGVVTAEVCQSREDRDVLSKMVEELDEGSGVQYKRFLAFPWILTVTWPMDSDTAEYPLVQAGPYGRWFHSEFCDFLSILVAQCQHNIIFDSYLMNTIIVLLSELSNSFIRAFRHTCTLAAVKLLSSLIGVSLGLSVAIENRQKLSKVQKTKTVRQKSVQQLERLVDLQEKRAEVESMMNVIIKAVFLKRYRDVLPEIRSICMEELGLWMKLYSSLFLNDSYLKYIGWMMSDKVPDVRLKCVFGLQVLYKDPLLLPKMDLFTSRFKERLISMTLDKDNDVALQTMKLLVLISKMSEDLLAPEDYKQLLQFVYSSQRPLAASAGELLYSRLQSAVAQGSDAQQDTNEEERHRLQSFAKLKALLHFFQESELHQHVVFLVDSLWDCGASLLKDWPTLTSALLLDSSSNTSKEINHGFTEAEQALLVEILVASVRQAAEGPVLAGRTGAKRVMSAKEKKMQNEDCLKLTSHLHLVLPTLLSKFSGCSDVVASLMRIPQYFSPECPEAENSQVMSSLVSAMAAVLDLHSDQMLLEAASRSYFHLCVDETTWCSTARPARDALVQNWVDRLKALLKDALQDGRVSSNEEIQRDILTTMRKLRAFHNCHNLLQWRVFDLLSPLLSEELPPEVLIELLQCLCYVILWSLNTSDKNLTCREDAVDQRLQLRFFCEKSHHCLSHRELGVRQQAFVGVCDVLTAHSYQRQLWDSLPFCPLIYSLSPKLQRALLTFTCEHVFVGPNNNSQSRVDQIAEEQRLEDLHRRRNLLAAYCKLIVHGVLEMSMAAEVFTQYVKYYNDFGDIIKETLYRTRQMDKMESARTLVLCLQQLFVQLKHKQERSSRPQEAVQTFTSIKELARRYALTFSDLVKFRECVVLIHRSGIEFVFQDFSQTADMTAPPYVSYLTILSEFSSKLLKPDKKTMFSYLQRLTANHITDMREECWQPLAYYRSSLLAAAEEEDAASNGSSDRKGCSTNRVPFTRQKPEGHRAPCLQSRLESKVGKVPRRSTSPSVDNAFAVPLEPPSKRRSTEGSELCTNNDESEDANVDIEF
ncbi:cohesin subunit SA-2 isoform X2 [Gouania willdenowi]|uniref:cohesin subunit SA-2 isoform X2 n=1 Tax=Gouania willdenowi TaxID=441366 RepID=UPI0010568FCD|nr:cohesin subunit SA-2-like isoform X2 [Gouania willdenowi]